MSRPTEATPTFTTDDALQSTRADDLGRISGRSKLLVTQDRRYFSAGLCCLCVSGPAGGEAFLLDREAAADLRDWLSDVLKYPDPQKTSPVRVVAFTGRVAPPEGL